MRRPVSFEAGSFGSSFVDVLLQDREEPPSDMATQNEGPDTDGYIEMWLVKIHMDI